LLDRSFYYGTHTCPYPGPWEEHQVPGIATLVEDQASSWGRSLAVCIGILYGNATPLTGVFSCVGGLPPVADRVGQLENLLTQVENKLRLNPSDALSIAQKVLAGKLSAEAKRRMRQQLALQGLIGFSANVAQVFDPLWQGRFQVEQAGAKYIMNV